MTLPILWLAAQFLADLRPRQLNATSERHGPECAHTGAPIVSVDASQTRTERGECKQEKIHSFRDIARELFSHFMCS